MDAVERLRALASREVLWVNTTGSGFGLTALLDSLEIPYFPITILGGGLPLSAEYGDAVFQKVRNDSGVQLRLTDASQRLPAPRCEPSRRESPVSPTRLPLALSTDAETAQHEKGQRQETAGTLQAETV